MPPIKRTPDGDRLNQVVAEARRHREQLEKSYRERALKLFPAICGRCGREFSGKRLRELTVHHKDHNHDNNPPDGSNWELLCLYCHDNEHGRQAVADAYDTSTPERERQSSFDHKPFAGLEALLQKKN
ncbi:MAG: YajD family HNH nuclease [Desulfatitalea sp.]